MMQLIWVYETDGRTSDVLLCEPPRMPTGASVTMPELADACPEPRIGFAICEWPRRIRFFCLTASLMRSTSCWYLPLTSKSALYEHIRIVWATTLKMIKNNNSISVMFAQWTWFAQWKCSVKNYEMADYNIYYENASEQYSKFQTLLVSLQSVNKYRAYIL